MSARTVQATNRPGRYADGGGLYLQVGPTGGKSWLFRYMIDGKAREMGLGAVHTLSLAEARVRAEACRKQKLDGEDPIDARRKEKRRRVVEDRVTPTFSVCAQDYVDTHRHGWKSAKHAAQWGSTLEAYAYPVIGELGVDQVDTTAVLEVLEPIWVTKTETASRVRGRIENILDWAAVRGYRSGENPARWKGHLDKILPARTKVQSVKHHAALPYKAMPAFMADLAQREGFAALGLKLLVLTATRTNEVLKARWDEFQLEDALWIIPKERMKMGREHRVPLSQAALELVGGLAAVRSGEYVLPGASAGRPLSNMAFLKLLERMGRGDLTAHGFRSTFRDWAAETTNHPRDVAEMALAHTLGNKVEEAYRRGDLFEKRRLLMEDWGRFCLSDVAPAAGNVVSLRPRGE